MGKLSEVLPGQRHPSSSVEPMETVYQLPEVFVIAMARQPSRPCSDDTTGPAKYLYTVWSNMKQRVLNPRHESWPFYGGRGVAIYPPWLDSKTFIHDILELIGPRPSDEVRANGLSVWEFDRINSYGNYEPGNVRWLRNLDNQRNKRKRMAKPASAKRPKRQCHSYADLDPTAAAGLPPYVISNSSGLFLNSSYRAI